MTRCARSYKAFLSGFCPGASQPRPRSRFAPVLALACLLGAGRQSLAWGDEDSRLLVGRGISQFDHGRYRDALGSFLQALELDPKDEKALYWQTRAAQALSEERRARLHKEGLEIARDSLNRTERERVAAILCERGYAALKSDDLASSARLYKGGRATTARHGCIALGLIMTRQALERKAARGEASADEILILAEFGRSGDGAWNMQTLARMGARPGAQPSDPHGGRQTARPGTANIRPAGSGAKVAGVPRSGAKSSLAEPPAEPDFRAFQTLPPAGTAPFLPLESPQPSEVKGAATMAWPRPKATADKPPRRLVPSSRDIGAAEELYMLAVADYMSGDAEKARESLAKALKLDPDNARAGTLLKRIQLEAR